MPVPSTGIIDVSGLDARRVYEFRLEGTALYAPICQQFSLYDEATPREFTILLEKPRTLRIRLVDNGGAPIAGLPVEIIPVIDGRLDKGRFLTSGSDGKVVAQGLLAEAEVHFTAAGYKSFFKRLSLDSTNDTDLGDIRVTTK
jgi:hypothetical protein